MKTLVFSYTVAIGILITLAVSGNASPLIQGLLMLVLPLIALWLFHVVLLTRLSNRNTGYFAVKRIPQVMVTTFLGLGGIIPVALPLISKNLVMSLVMPLSPLAVMAWWAMVVLGALVAGLLIFLYESWAVRRGFNAWTVFESREGEATTPGWRKTWWWILVSIVILLAGMITGAMLAK